MPMDAPEVPDEFMNEADTAGGKRTAESEGDRVKKAARGNAVVSNFIVEAGVKLLPELIATISLPVCKLRTEIE